MKKITLIILFVACAFMCTTFIPSCGLNSEDPDHPSYVSYSIGMGYTDYDGPDFLLLEIEKWIHENSVFLKEEVKYSTGATSEFAAADAKAIKEFEKFVPKAENYFAEVKAKLARGEYGDTIKSVNGKFYAYVMRVQGEDNTLKTANVPLVFP